MRALPPLQVWPVLHVADAARRDLTWRNAQMVWEAGCPGVFLIHMQGDNEAALAEALWVRNTFPTLRVGVNLLGEQADQAMRRSLATGLQATWSDAPNVSSQGIGPVAQHVRALLHAHPEHTFFGSVAFKYQPAEPDAPAAARLASTLGMVATTSGPATGRAPDLAKLQSMRAALGRQPLAVASGITPENLPELGAHLTHVLVATGISRSFYELAPARLRQLMTAAASLRFAG